MATSFTVSMYEPLSKAADHALRSVSYVAVATGLAVTVLAKGSTPEDQNSGRTFADRSDVPETL